MNHLKDHMLIAECFDDLGYKRIALAIKHFRIDQDSIDRYMKSLIKKCLKHSDIFNRLYYAGLVYTKEKNL